MKCVSARSQPGMFWKRSANCKLNTHQIIPLDTHVKLVVEAVVFLDLLVHKENPVDTVNQVNQVMLVIQDSLADHLLSVKRLLMFHANLVQMVPMVNPDPPDLPETLVPLDNLVHQVKMVELEMLDLLVHQEDPDLPDPMAHLEMLVNQDQVPQVLQETKDLLVMQDLKDNQDNLVDQDQMEHQVNQELKDHQDPPVTQEKTVNQVKMAQLAHQVHKEKRESVLNIVLLMVVFSLKMEAIARHKFD